MYNQNIVYLQRFLSFVAIPTMKRKELTDEQYADVKTLVHDTVGLSELLNQ